MVGGLIFKIAFRNIFRQKRRSMLTALTMVGGFTLAAVSIGWADGSYNSVIDMFTRHRLGHIQVHHTGYLDRPSIYKTIDNYRQVGRVIGQTAGVEAWTPRLFAGGLASLGDRSSGIQIIGVDPVAEARATRLDRQVTRGKYFSGSPAGEALLGRGLAEILKANLGDEVVLISQAADGSMANDLYRVQGIVDSGDDVTDRMSFYLPLDVAQSLLVLPDRVHEIAIIVTSLDEVQPVTRTLRTELDNPNLDIEPWQVFARSFYSAMQADQRGMWIMLFVIMLIVAVGVLNTVLMSVLERTREYGVLKAVGTRPRQVFRLILYEMSMLALGSVALGALLGTLINYLLSFHGIPLPEPFTYGGVEFTTMYTEVTMRSLVIPAVTVLVAASTVSILPALRAAHIDPARALRTH